MVPPALPVLIQFASPSVRANWGAPKPFEFSLYFVKGEGRVGVGWVAIARGIQLERGVSLTRSPRSYLQRHFMLCPCPIVC